ncbi:E3 ubiquitin-protein ligase MARCHF3 isoform X1 [Kryptolebias marmoratus]|uniref:E3 ubiquitin-protein ligase MARCHF3 isoform X1 n=2 Tax=Kryptolebias marmoratus TaxID=37003 RepID=UPI0007F8D586|nr:E3 ubiquitin-protein ligase MARCHF3 isoform X1 [Kryptolebias marmoratus]
MDVCTKQAGVPEEAVCRICHDSGVQEELLCPCECAGARAPVHRSCLEQRLAASRTGSCELCHCRFAVRKKPRPLLEWLQISGLQQETRTLFGDLVCFLLITPLATISGWLCLRRAVDHLYFSSQLEAVGLIALTVTLFTIYLFWALVSLVSHCRPRREWRQSGQRVTLLPGPHGERSSQHSLRSAQQRKEQFQVLMV